MFGLALDSENQEQAYSRYIVHRKSENIEKVGYYFFCSYPLFSWFCSRSLFKGLQPKNKAADIAFETAKAEADMKTMDEFYLYHGQESYSVIIGTTSGGEKKIVWIPDNDREKIVDKKCCKW